MGQLRILLFSITVMSFANVVAQPLFMPLEIKSAYDANTRSADGNPGANYWQNYANYTIDAQIHPGSWKVEGIATIKYHNNSPDSLDRIVIKKYPDMYKKGGVRLSEVHPENINEGMILDYLMVNNDTIDLNDPKIAYHGGTYIMFLLPNKLPPTNTLELEVKWSTYIPVKYDNRIGAYDSVSAFMGYWYPQIAVYDDIDGWDRTEYHAVQEFYRDFADFNVSLTVPSGYTIWATGELQNPEEVFSENVLNKWKASQVTDSTVVILSGGTNTSAIEPNTWNFIANNVQDFAAGISNDFRWEASSIQLGDNRVLSNVVYNLTDTARLTGMVQKQNEMLEFFSKDIPGVNYPYPQFTSFFGVSEYDGMEYPMLANNGSHQAMQANDAVVAHELAHTYFPFYVGINEIKYSWMEEGWASFLDLKYIKEHKPNYLWRGTDYESSYFQRFNFYTGHQWEVPLIAPSYASPYRYQHVHQAYFKPAVFYLLLEDLLGKELFKTVIQTYIERWAGKHPIPYDFLYTIENSVGEDLSWFWNPWLFNLGYPDLAIESVSKEGVLVKNLGYLPVPIHINVTYKDGSVKTIYRSVNVWQSGIKELVIEIPKAKNAVLIELNTDRTPDSNDANNHFVVN